jgi:uncharacterized protein
VADSLPIRLSGERVELLADRALYWPAKRRLLVADLHLGKADEFRRAGIALPIGGTGHDLARISALVEATGAGSVWILGDLLHGAIDTTHWRQGWNAWRAHHPRLHVAAVAGNHDRALAAAGLGVELLGEQVDEPPFLFRHAPLPTVGPDPACHVVCGHLHPKLALPGLPGTWPGFWLRAGTTILPAFSRVTGGVVVRVGHGERFAVCSDGALAMVAGPAP